MFCTFAITRPGTAFWARGRPWCWSRAWRGGFELLGPLARCLAQHFQVISYQLRGEEDCFVLRRRFDFLDLVEDLDELLSACGLERPGVMGVSFGGALALELAIRKPHRVSALAVQGAGGRFERSLFQRVTGEVLSRFPLPSDSPFLNQFFNLLFGRRQEPGPLVDFVTQQCWQTDQSVMAHRFQLVEPFDVRGRGASATLPVLALAGTRDVLVSSEGLCDLARSLPDVRCRRLPDCGHLAFVTHPELVAREVWQFLREQMP